MLGRSGQGTAVAATPPLPRSYPDFRGGWPYILGMTRFKMRTVAGATRLRDALVAIGSATQSVRGSRKAYDTSASEVEVRDLAEQLLLSQPWFVADSEGVSPISDAAKRNLPPCGKCKAYRGDPCRSPSGATRYPHVERKESP